MQSGHIVIRSRDRNKSLSPSPADVFINSNISYFSNSNIRSIEGESFEAYYAVPNINPRNNTLVIDDGGTSYPVPVPEDYYDYDSLASALETQLNTLGLGAFSVDWDTTNANKFTLTSPVAVSIVQYPPQRKDLSEVMGFTQDVNGTVFLGTLPDLTYTRNIYVVSDAFHDRKRIDDQTSTPLLNNLVMEVPVYWNEYHNINELVPRNIFHQPNVPKKINFDNTTTISNIDVRLYDDQGEVLYVPSDATNAINWRLTLNISRDL